MDATLAWDWRFRFQEHLLSFGSGVRDVDSLVSGGSDRGFSGLSIVEYSTLVGRPSCLTTACPRKDGKPFLTWGIPVKMSMRAREHRMAFPCLPGLAFCSARF